MIKKLTFGAIGKMKNASTIDQVSQQVQVEYTEEEQMVLQRIRDTWENILGVEVDDDTDFFACGAGSMDVVRLVTGSAKTPDHD